MGVDAKGFNKGLASARRDLNSFASSMSVIGLAVGGFGAAAAAGLYKVVVAASNVQEQADAVRDTFGKSAYKVLDFTELLAKGYGVAKATTLEASHGLAALFKNAGYASDQVADLSIHFVQLALDASRFKNVRPENALIRIKSGLEGETEAVRKLGVSMLEADVEAYAYAKGIAKVGAELTSTQKIQSRAGLITQGLVDAMDNLAKTGDKTAGAIEGVKGRFENLAATIGESLLVVAAPLLVDLQVSIHALSMAWADSALAAIGASDSTIAGIQSQHGSIGILQQAVMGIADAWQIVDIGVRALGITGTTVVLTLLESFKLLGKGISSVVTLIPGIKPPPQGGFLDAWVDDMTMKLDKMTKEFMVASKAPWASGAVAKAHELAAKDIQDARDALKARGRIDVNAIKPNPVISQFGKEHKGFADAAEFGSRESANIQLRSAYGMSVSSGPAQQTAQNTAKTNVILEKIAQAISNTNPVQAGFLNAF